ncbi:iron uptake cluster protein [Epithele typhae]|uniref:iron uptake cluster protein n=1 Tax=Epithele typhae TaxID=378194 RepID=UPI0020072BD9|nr:iron uptake cluster protein [Epithele typhae]KAH9934039.1 iron uptake cluster protein [Epithele typhae]
MKTVDILGGSYGGARAATTLAQGLPHSWRIIIVGRNSHINYHKAFIPYNNVFLPLRTVSTPGSPGYTNPARLVMLHASVTSLATRTLTLDRAFPEHGVSEADRTLHFDCFIYALGLRLPSPTNLWNPATEDVEKAEVLDVARGTKQGGVAFPKQFQLRVSRAASVVVVGGALCIYIAEIYPATNVTLLHSRDCLLPRFDEAMHSEIISSLSGLNICTMLGDRLDLASLADNKHSNGERVVRTQSGCEVQAKLVLLCTGQSPNTWLLRDAFPKRVLAEPPPSPNPRPLSPTSPRFPSRQPAPLPDPRLRNPPSPTSPQPTRPSDDASETSSQAEDAQLENVEDARTRVAGARIFAIRGTKSVYQYQGVIGTRDQEQADLDIHMTRRYFGYEVERGDLDADLPDEEIPGAAPRPVYTTKEVMA